MRVCQNPVLYHSPPAPLADSYGILLDLSYNFEISLRKRNSISDMQTTYLIISDEECSSFRLKVKMLLIFLNNSNLSTRVWQQ